MEVANDETHQVHIKEGSPFFFSPFFNNIESNLWPQPKFHLKKNEQTIKSVPSLANIRIIHTKGNFFGEKFSIQDKPKCSKRSLDSKIEDFRCLAKLHANDVTCK